MLRPGEHLVCRPLLDHPAVAQDHDAMRQRPNHPQIVTDEQVAELMVGLQLLQQIDDLRLHRHVQGTGRFVQHHEPRFQHHCARDRDALPLTAAELVRVAVTDIGREADLMQRLRHPDAALRARQGGLVHGQALGDDLRHRHPRRQAAERILEDDLHIRAQSPQPLLVEFGQVRAVETDIAVRRHQPQQRIAHGGFAGAAFADQSDGLALMNHHIDAIDRTDVPHGAAQHAAPDREVHAHIGSVDQRGRGWAQRQRPSARFGGQQHTSIRVERSIEHRRHRPGLHHDPILHHADPVGIATHDRQVMADQQQRQPSRRFFRRQQFQDLCLDGDVERRRRLVRDQQRGVVGQCHRDHHPLPLAAG